MHSFKIKHISILTYNPIHHNVKKHSQITPPNAVATITHDGIYNHSRGSYPQSGRRRWAVWPSTSIPADTVQLSASDATKTNILTSSSSHLCQIQFLRGIVTCAVSSKAIFWACVRGDHYHNYCLPRRSFVRRVSSRSEAARDRLATFGGL